MFCFGCGRVEGGAELHPPVTLEEVRCLNVRLAALENLRAGVGPQLSFEVIGGIVAEAQRAEREMRLRTEMTHEEQQALIDLQANLLATHYRDNAEVGYQGDPVSDGERADLEANLLRFRQNSKLFPRCFDELTESDRIQIDLLSQCYPDYVRHLLASEKHLETFFKWALRSHCTIHVFVQFPSMTRQLMACHADKRFGAAFDPGSNDSGLRVNPAGFVEMKVYGGYANGAGRHDGSTYISLHDPEGRIALTNRVNAAAPPYIITIGEIFRQLKAKTTQYGQIEVLQDGLSVWDTIRQGSYNPATGEVDRIEAARWMEMPPLAVVTLEQMRARFQGQEIDAESVKFALCSSRRHLPTRIGPRVDDTHAYLIVFIPNDDGTFNEICLGLQPYDLPKNIVDKLWYIGSTKPAEVHIHDESRFLSHREQKGIIFDLSLERGEVLRGHIAYEIEKGRRGEKTFGPQGNNCANWVQKAMWKVLIDTLLFNSLRESAASHRNRNLPSYVRALERSTKAGNETAQRKNAERIVAKLGHHDLIDLIRRCHDLLRETLYKDHSDQLLPLNGEALERVNVKQLRTAARNLLIATLRVTQIFPMRTLDLDASVGFFNYILRGLKLLVIANIVSQVCVARFIQIVNFLFFFSWRFSTTLKSLVTNKYSQAGTQASPSGMWAWHEHIPIMEKEVCYRIRQVNALPLARITEAAG